MTCTKCDRDVWPASVRGLCLDCWSDEEHDKAEARRAAAAEKATTEQAKATGAPDAAHK